MKAEKSPAQRRPSAAARKKFLREAAAFQAFVTKTIVRMKRGESLIAVLSVIKDPCALKMGPMHTARLRPPPDPQTAPQN